MKPADISYNFSIAKVLSILMVAAGHYFGGLLWIPTTIALFIFAFSSGYFSSSKYTGDFSVKKFWKAKVIRLGLSLALINLFLLALFLVSGKNNLMTWDTLWGMSGLSAALAWFGLPYHSPFGYGQWFLTVLWIYYLAYPAIERINRNSGVATAFLLSALVFTTYLNFHVLVGYELWITVFGFILGTYAGRIPARMTFVRSGGTLVACITSMLILNKFFNVNSLNYYFILVSSVMVCNILLVRRLPDALGPPLLPLQGVVLEIYLLHCYLFVRFPASAIAGFTLSLTLILLTAMTLGRINLFLAAVRRKLGPA
ncbi:acyltransferase family protein [Ferrovum sp.]|uniref:acyltransferase family protein n=1 Tax=Ferrovum sp. TaxID=2609467 RepID=UPI0026331F04|nr:acyltransferase family protein [Ferrovum sp.]